MNGVDLLSPKVNLTPEQIQKFMDGIKFDTAKVGVKETPLSLEQLKLFKERYETPVRTALVNPTDGERMDIWLRERVEELRKMIDDRLDDSSYRLHQTNQTQMLNLFREQQLQMAVLQDQIAELFDLLSDE